MDYIHLSESISAHSGAHQELDNKQLAFFFPVFQNHFFQYSYGKRSHLGQLDTGINQNERQKPLHIAQTRHGQRLQLTLKDYVWYYNTTSEH